MLGDIVDDEITDTIAIKKLIKKIHCKNMILIKGNNDLFDDDFYYDCGFKKIAEAYKYKNVIFSHYPISVPKDIYNIHGHLHGTGVYYDKSFTERNHIDIQILDTIKPVNLNTILPILNSLYYPKDDIDIINGLITLHDIDHDTGTRRIYDDAEFRYIHMEKAGESLAPQGFVEGKIIQGMLYGNILVSRKYRKQGVGVKLLERLYDFAVTENIPIIIINVKKSNITAQKILKDAGYVIYDSYMDKIGRAHV